MYNKKILIADDEPRMRKLLRDFLVRDGYEVIEAEDGLQAVDRFCADHEISLVILDVMMPKLDGYQACREIRKLSKVPIVMVTAKSEEQDELLGFELGVDEYITKPFSPKILTARVDAILRRTGGEQKQILSAGGLELNQLAHIVKANGQVIDLSYKEFELLTYFMENRGVALSRENILNHVWNYDFYGDARTIDTHVKKLRSKLGEQGNLIQTVWGMGYKFDV